jgi:uncharacterized membrane protein YccF (DUF307 family)
MTIIGNILWLIFGGILFGLACYIMGLLLCITIIGIPFGLQLFKLGNLFFWPFGSVVDTNFDKHPIANILWIIFAGWELCLSCLFTGIFFYITIIGIPFGKQWFKLARLSLIPFGADLK